MLAVTIGYIGIGALATPQIRLQTVRCEEDMPCWDCETMGNGICGLTPSEDAAERAESLTDNGQR